MPGQDWQQLEPVPIGTPDPFFRSMYDARLAMFRRIPAAEYPDGYLGTVPSRRGDRVLDSLKGRQNERSYQRGVHKGERIDPGDYFWPPEFGPMNGLSAQAAGVRQRPLLELVPVLLTNEGKALPRGAASLVAERNPDRAQQLAHLGPSWG